MNWQRIQYAIPVFFSNLLWIYHNFNYSLFFCDFFRNKTDLWKVSYFELAEQSVCNFLCKTYFGSNIYFNYSLLFCDFFRNKTDLWEVLNFHIFKKIGSICIDAINAKCGEGSAHEEIHFVIHNICLEITLEPNKVMPKE